MSFNFLIVGGDKRIVSLAKKLRDDGHNIRTYANNIEDIEEIKTKEELYNDKSGIIISSIPLSMDNVNVYTPLSDKTVSIDDIKKISKNKIFIAGNIKDINGYDILRDEPYTILNTIPTAEGAIQIAMEETTYTLSSLKILVLGFGRVGKVLCNKIKNIGVKEIYCSARREEDLAWIEAYGYNPIDFKDIKENMCKMDIIFNTIPSKILDKNLLILLNRETLIVDLASKPGGVDYVSANKLKIKAILASGLPGKVAPDTVSEYIKKYIYKIIYKK